MDPPQKSGGQAYPQPAQYAPQQPSPHAMPQQPGTYAAPQQMAYQQQQPAGPYAQGTPYMQPPMGMPPQQQQYGMPQGQQQYVYAQYQRKYSLLDVGAGPLGVQLKMLLGMLHPPMFDLYALAAGVPVAPMVGQPGAGQTVVVVEQNIYFGSQPTACVCPNCRNNVVTNTVYTPGALSWLVS